MSLEHYSTAVRSGIKKAVRNTKANGVRNTRQKALRLLKIDWSLGMLTTHCT